ncbi:hypothetical protein ACFRAQ_17065 [Nocardia sp. NPDC056611]|uniref:hypothetical protein n=1 Tax=unclassified Nocardia TaxID=2637762 RepID=UPI00366D7DFE
MTWRFLVNSPTPPPSRLDALGRLGADWWSVIVSGVVVALAVLGVLPKIPW